MGCQVSLSFSSFFFLPTLAFGFLPLHCLFLFSFLILIPTFYSSLWFYFSFFFLFIFSCLLLVMGGLGASCRTKGQAVTIWYHAFCWLGRLLPSPCSRIKVQQRLNLVHNSQRSVLTEASVTLPQLNQVSQENDRQPVVNLKRLQSPLLKEALKNVKKYTPYML